MTVEKTVRAFKTDSEYGFTNEEIDSLLSEHYPNINMRKFNNALGALACTVVDDKMRIYPIDVIQAIYCGIGNRDLRSLEWD